MYAFSHCITLCTWSKHIRMRNTMSQVDTQADVSDTSIRVSDELADELYSRKNRGESYEDVIWRLIDRADAEGE